MWNKDPTKRASFSEIARYLESISGFKLTKTAFDELPTVATDDARSRAPRKHKHSKVMARMKNIVESPIEALMEKREERSRKLV